MLCDRINAYKKRFYRLDINIGRVQLFSYLKTHFDEEQKKAQLLKR